MTTQTKPKRRSTTRKRKTKTETPAPNAFFAKALTVSGRFTLAWMLFKAGLRILIKGRALV